jgi:glycosyltransferase involved in cell wall biosynthesis
MKSLVTNEALPRTQRSSGLSAIIITKNEEDNIARSVKSVQFCDEVIVVDAESNDRTVEIAKKLGARTFVRPWPGYGSQKNFGAAQAQGEWLLFIDADEEVTPELAQEIQTELNSPRHNFYWLKIITIFLGRPLNHLYGHNPRLFRKSQGSWTGYKVHEQVQTNAGQKIVLGDNLSTPLRRPLLHHSHATMAAYLRRMAEYTALDSQQMAIHNRHRSGRPVRPTWWLPHYLAARQFAKMYVYKKGLLDGYVGLVWSALSAYYEWTMAKKYILLKEGKKDPGQPVLR